MTHGMKRQSLAHYAQGNTPEAIQQLTGAPMGRPGDQVQTPMDADIQRAREISAGAASMDPQRARETAPTPTTKGKKR